jgi:hypothetical protein
MGMTSSLDDGQDISRPRLPARTRQTDLEPRPPDRDDRLIFSSRYHRQALNHLARAYWTATVVAGLSPFVVVVTILYSGQVLRYPWWYQLGAMFALSGLLSGVVYRQWKASEVADRRADACDRRIQRQLSADQLKPRRNNRRKSRNLDAAPQLRQTPSESDAAPCWRPSK